MFIYEKNSDRKVWFDMGQGSREQAQATTRRATPKLSLVPDTGSSLKATSK
jgi:hypothetical protein